MSHRLSEGPLCFRPCLTGAERRRRARRAIEMSGEDGFRAAADVSSAKEAEHLLAEYLAGIAGRSPNDPEVQEEVREKVRDARRRAGY